MLKALELLGFKSFADKTRFEFSPGITVVVGPNGSGKSNIVDAVKWVLGEQSVKSLRGREMADVIFNGSGARRATNSAEVTLSLDNVAGRLGAGSSEVQITRRVYRSGESEYLLNRQPCRLRDIRDLLAGTGMGAEAYCVIEQGKVDVLLQASPRDRRAIFEEAAGISRFKLKKVEALRRLERVEQNLLRLSDIVEEVDGRLRSVRAQAGKARRYKEYTDRLQDLRTQVGLVDWRRLTDRLTLLESQVRELTEQRDTAAAAAEAIEARALAADTHMGDFNESIHHRELQIAAARERISAAESAIDQERSRNRDLDEEISRRRRQLVAASARAGDLKQQIGDTTQAVEQAEEGHRQVARTLAEAERKLTDALAQVDHVRGENQRCREALLEQMRLDASLGNEAAVLEGQLASVSESRQRTSQRKTALDGQATAIARNLDQLRRQQEDLTLELQQREQSLATGKSELAAQQQQLATVRDELAQLLQRRSGVAERIALLEELERRQEGLSAGVREVLAEARGAQPGALRQIHGLVADLLQVSVETAPLIEAVLGPSAQYVVAPHTSELLDYLKDYAPRLSGRVGFVWWDQRSGDCPNFRLGENGTVPLRSALNLEGRPGVLGRADRFVETEPRFASLASQLLGATWIVETLPQAIALAESVGGGLSLVTLAGETLSPDGTLVVGPRHGAGGLISRRSQLRALAVGLADCDRRIAEVRAAEGLVQQRIAECEQQVQLFSARQHQAADALAEHRVKLATVEQERAGLDQQCSELDAELIAADAQYQQAHTALAGVRSAKTAAESALATLEARSAGLADHLRRLEAQQQTCAGEATEAKVDLAHSEERLRNLHARRRQLEEGQQERQRAIGEGHDQLAEAIERARASSSAILRAESEIAELYIHKEADLAEARQLAGQRAELQQQRTELAAEGAALRAGMRGMEEKIHAGELEASQLHLERTALLDRLREDYGIDLSQQENAPTQEEQQQREAVQQEIDELRGKINHLGNVNLESLDELQQLEDRYGVLSAQYKDLTSAKGSLEKIIETINSDSRRLFAETLETVKGHFQQLFRDLFGGGRADIVLEEGVDILESGVEIVARPPGKEPRSISLLSGGEKTLTCVALLLAVFHNRPSPFCLLDEVDAALDEANIDRFIRVLQGFLKNTQFIMVTHSKKTMTCASTLYGVTMQESGVSKQVSVRFEDVSEDGQIRPERLAAEPPPPQDEAEAA